MNNFQLGQTQLGIGCPKFLFEGRQTDAMMWKRKRKLFKLVKLWCRFTKIKCPNQKFLQLEFFLIIFTTIHLTFFIIWNYQLSMWIITIVLDNMLSYCRFVHETKYKKIGSLLHINCLVVYERFVVYATVEVFSFCELRTMTFFTLKVNLDVIFFHGDKLVNMCDVKIIEMCFEKFSWVVKLSSMSVWFNSLWLLVFFHFILSRTDWNPSICRNISRS